MDDWVDFILTALFFALIMWLCSQPGFGAMQ